MDTGGGGGSPAATAAAVNPNLNGSAPPPFLSKTYEMVDDPATDAIVSWGPGDNSFVVWNTPEFARDLLPKYFKHNNFSSFVRQLNTYGFRKVDPDRWEFANEGFLRGQKQLLKTITRRKPSHAHTQPPHPQPQNSSVSACVEVGKFGLEEEIERLKRDKNVLMQELVRLRQQQQATDHQLQTLGKRFQAMEQRQQQMMSFLAKAMHSPGFLAQLVQQNDSSRRIAAVNKKRRLPKQDGESTSPDGQIIKYQPLMTEAAKEMLRQILKLGSSPRLESLGGSSNLSVENFPSSCEALNNTSSSRNSGVTLAEVPPNSGTSYVPVNSGFSASDSPSAVSDVLSPPGATDMIATNELPDLGVISPVPEDIALSPNGTSIPDFLEFEGLLPDDLVENFCIPESDIVYANPITAGMDEASMPIETENIGTDSDINIVYDEDQTYDPFWEQIVTGSLISGDVEEIQSSKQEARETQTTMEKGWDSAQNMEHLTEQMGLLNSDSTGR